MPTQSTAFRKRIHTKKTSAPKVSKNVSRYVKRTLNNTLASRIEHKFRLVDATGAASIPVSGLGAVYHLSQPPQGLQDTARIGDTVRWGTLRFNYGLNWNGLASYELARARVILFQWMDSTSGLAGPPTAAGVLQDVNAHVYSTIRHDPLKAGTIKIMYDKVHTLDLDDKGSTHSVVRLPPHRKSQFDTGGINGTGQLFLLVIGDQGVNPLDMEFFARVNFTDA